MRAHESLRRAAGEIAERISTAAQLALILEASADPKPGNVTRHRGFRDTRYQHFLASGVAAGPEMRKLAHLGAKAGTGEIRLSSVRLGLHIRRCASNVSAWHRGGNTIFGAITLLAPLAAGAGFTLAKVGRLHAEAVRKSAWLAIRATTVSDAVEFYRALRQVRPGGLEAVKVEGAPDALAPNAEREVQRRRLTLLEVMKAGSPVDGVCREWSTGMRTIFQLGLPTLREVFDKTGDINTSTVQCFLRILATQPDTHIVRKHGAEMARKVSAYAAEALEAGGCLTARGLQRLEGLDRKLRAAEKPANPGTTADLTAATLFVALLCGLKP